MKIKTLSICTAIMIAQTTASAAQIDLDPVVVSSDFRTTTLSRTAGAVSLISQEDIVDKASENFEDVIAQTPNVNFTSGASRAHYIQIRGIGERSQFVSPVNPSVGIMIDGIDFSQSALAVTLFDVAQMEILKGPQGTTFGTNGLAGVVNIISNQPTKETEAHAEATLGNYNRQAAGVALGGTLIKDKLLGRISLYKNTSDGFMKNSFLNRKDTQNIDELTLKTQLKWLLSDKHTIDFNYIHLDVDNGYDAFTFDNSRTSTADNPGRDAQKTDAFALKSTYQINPKMHLESKLSGSKSDLEYSYDEDWSYVGQFAAELYPYNYVDAYLRDRKQIDGDVRLISDADGKIFSNSTDWTAGAYFRNQKEDLTRNRLKEGTASTFTSDYETNNIALYGQLDSALSKRFTLVTGLRVEKWDAKYSDSKNVKIDTDEVLTGGKIGIKFQQDEKHMHYIMLSRGYKPGGVNADDTLTPAAKDYDTESLWNLEAGRNFTALDDSLLARVNIFYGQRRDQQVKSSIAGKDAEGNPNFIDYIANAAKTHYYGMEATMDYYPMESVHLFSSLGLLQSKFDDYKDPNPEAYKAEGRTPAQSPKYQYNVGFDYAIADLALFKTNIEGRGSYYFSNRHAAKADSYNLINSSLTIFDGKWSATLWGRNLADSDYQVRGFGSFGNNPAKGYATETYTQQGNPRTYGLTVSYDY